MPDFAGVDLDQAEQELADLAVDVDLTVNRVDDDADADTVIGHQPAPGVALPEGAAVVLRVSDGPTTASGEEDEDDKEEAVELVKVPDVVGMALDHAQQALEDAGLRGLRRGTRGTDEAEPGTVLEQSPEPGEMVEANKAVRLVIVDSARSPRPGRTRRALSITPPLSPYSRAHRSRPPGTAWMPAIRREGQHHRQPRLGRHVRS